MTSSREKGLEIFRTVFGDAAADGATNYMETDSFGVEGAKWAMDFPFGTVWARDQLDRKMRSCAVLGMLIALRQVDEISHHTKMGLANGLTRTEIEEIFYSSIPYCGFPASNIAKTAMLKAFEEIDAAA